MEHAARRFARRTLLVHALLLAAVLATVAVAGRQVYRAARDEVIAQAEGRQRLLAAQTARGIENHYASILTDMDLLRRADVATDANAASPATTRATVPPAERTLTRLLAGVGRNPGVGQVIGSVMWRQLQGRATMLFSYDRTPPSAAHPVVPPRLIGSDDPGLTPEVVIQQAGDWLAAQRAPGVGDYQRFGDVAGNLVCIPLRDQGPSRGEPMRFNTGRGSAFRSDANRFDGPPPDDRFGNGPPRGGNREPPPDEPRRPDEFATTRPTRPDQPRPEPARAERALVAVVPIARVEEDFLRPLNDDPATTAWLLDQRWTTMAASRTDLVGMDMTTMPDPDLKRLAAQYVGQHMAGCEVIDRSFTVGSAHFEPAMVAAEPVTIADRRWELFVATSLESVDGNVNQLFRRAVGWGAVVSVAIAGILASTAVGLIRGRMRVERLRHEVLTRELGEARRIQLAWLPKSSPTTDVVDVAAVNSPANHISGDFYNWFELPDGRLAVAIGDVTGHGMSAAFLMATTQLLVRTTLARVPDPGACLAEVNRQLCVQAFNGQFVTMLVAVLDPARLRLELATAGHPPPLLVTDGRTFHPLPIEPQLVLGVDPEATYPTESHDLPPGAGLLLYTDGVVECPAPDRTPLAGQRFGTDRLRRAVAQPSAGGSARMMVDRVVAAVDAFRGPRELDDDLTVVAVQLRVPSAKPALRYAEEPGSIAGQPAPAM
jgi:serine phosphatase RsbU (regulator of sigma subunit)